MGEKFEVVCDEWWYEITANIVRLGISEQLRRDIGEINEVVFPPIGAVIQENEIISELITDQIKSSLPSPINGVVSAYNEEAMLNPQILNTSDRNKNWLILMELEEKLSVSDIMKD
jgi:glycine cleavage system H protein